MAALSPVAKQQFFDNAGNPAAGFRLYTYAANTTTPLATYANKAGTVANPNPITLDSRGEATVYLMEAMVYDFVLKTDEGVTVWTREGVSIALDVNSEGTVEAVSTAILGALDEMKTAGVAFQYNVTAGQTEVDVSDIEAPYIVGQVFYNGVFQSPSAYAVEGGTLTFTEELPVAGEVAVIAGYRSPNQITDAQYLTNTIAATGAQTRTLRAKLSDTVSVKDFGAVGDGVTDDTAAILAAIASLGSRGGRVKFPAGDFLYSAEIVLDKAGITLSGAGRSGHFGTGSPGGGSVGGATRLIAAHTTGACIRIKRDDCTIEGMTVDASTDRSAATLGDNYGIHIESDDAPGQSTKRTKLNQVRVTNQPSHGIVWVDDTTSSRAEMATVDNCGGHGFLIAGPSFTGRTNRSRPGQIQLDNCLASRCGGHALLVGVLDEDTATDLPYRVEAHNFEQFYCAGDAAVRLADVSTYISGENHTFDTCATSGRGLVTPDERTTLRLRGTNIFVRNHRCINGNPYAIYVEDHPLWQTKGVTIDGLFIDNDNQGAGFYNPAVYIEPGCEFVTVQTNGNFSDVATLASTDSTAYYVEYNGVVQTNRKHKTRVSSVSGFTSSAANVTIPDDGAAYIEFSAAGARGMLAISGSVKNNATALVSFRVGDANAHATVLASAGKTVAGATGTATGTSGTDNQMNVFADTASNRLYIENRTGSSSGYAFTLLNLNSGVTAAEAVAV